MSYIGKNPKVDSVKLDGSATVPTGAAVEGQVYFNTGTGAISEGLKVYKNGQFVSIDKQLGDADTIDLLKASDVGGLQWKVAINSTSTTVGMNSPVPQYNATATGFANASSTFANSSTGNALLTNESADIVFAYESHTVNSKNDYFGIQVDIPKAFRGQNLVLQFEYRTAEASTAVTSDSDFLVSIQDDTNKAQTTNSTTTGSQAAGTSVAVASSTGFAVGDKVRVESGTAASGNQANSFTEAYVTAIADSTHLTFSETIVFPASGTTGIIAANWLIDQNAGQLVEADSDTNKVGKVYKVQFKTEETTAKINISIMNQSTTAAGIDIFVDNILITGNKFLQASSQTKTESYNIPQQSNVWDGSGTSTYTTFDASLVEAGPDTPPLADSNLVEIADITGPGTVGTVTAVKAKQNITLHTMITMYASNSGELHIVNSSEQNLCSSYAPNSAAAGYEVVSASINLAKDDYVYYVSHDSGARDASFNAVAVPQTSDVILLESQDEIFTDWTDFTPSFATGGGPPTVHEARWRRVGSDMQVYMGFAVGTTTASNAKFEVPAGYSIDATAFSTTTSNYHPVGNYGVPNQNYSANTYISANVTTPTTLYFTYADSAGYNYNTVRDWNHLFSSSEKIECWFCIPIQGWNANFNPLLSLPLVEIGANVEEYQVAGGGADGGTKSFRPYFDSTSTYYSLNKNTISTLGTVDNSSTMGWSFTASQRVKVHLAASIGNNSGSGLWSIVKTPNAPSTYADNANSDAIWNGFRLTNNTPTVAGASINGAVSFIMEPGEYVQIVRNFTGIETVAYQTSLALMVEKDFSNTNMAHIIKPAVATIKDVKIPWNTSGGASTAFSTAGWGTRDLNTIGGESWFIESLASNIFTLEAGTYEIEAYAPFYQCDTGMIRLYDNTNSAQVILGSHRYAGSTGGSSGFANLTGQFTITASTAFKIQFATQTAKATDGLGIHVMDSAIGESVYTCVQLRKLK